MARAAPSMSLGSQEKFGAPCERFSALCCAASWPITVKIVVPTSGNFERGVQRLCIDAFYPPPDGRRQWQGIGELSRRPDARPDGRRPLFRTLMGVGSRRDSLRC
jgi:hypothetical protein